MSLLGGLLGIGRTHAPPAPPPPEPTTPSGQGAIDPAAGAGGGGDASSTGSGPSGGAAAGSGGATGSAAPGATPQGAAPAASGGSPASAGTPSDGAAVRFDFRPDAATVPEDDRTRALANQDRERVAALIERVGTPARAAHLRLLGGSPGAEAGAYADNLKTLRGTDQPAGKLLDRAA